MSLVILALSLSLSLDALATGLSYGCRRIKIPFMSMAVMGFISVSIMLLSMYCGNLLILVFNPFFAGRIGVILLLLIGMRLVTLAVLNNHNGKSAQPVENGVLFSLAFKWLGIMVQVIKHPGTADLDDSGVIDLNESLVLALAMSVDSFGVGMAVAVSGFPLLITSVAVGLCQVLLLKAGHLVSGWFTICISDRWVLSLLPGSIILAIAALKIAKLI